VWAHLYRTKFFESDRVIIDDPLLVGNKFHAFPQRPLLEFVNAKGNKHYREYKLRDAIRASFKMREGVDHPNYFPVRMLDLSKKCLNDHYRDAGGELPCESQLQSHIENGTFPMMCMLVHADVVNEKIGISHTPPTPDKRREHDEIINSFLRKISAPGYYPFNRPTTDFCILRQDVRDFVELYKHTRDFGVSSEVLKDVEADGEAANTVPEAEAFVDDVLVSDSEVLVSDSEDRCFSPHRPAQRRIFSPQSPSPPLTPAAKRPCATLTPPNSRASTKDSRRGLPLSNESAPRTPRRRPPTMESVAAALAKHTTNSPRMPLYVIHQEEQDSESEDWQADVLQHLLPPTPKNTPPDPFPKSVSSQPYERS
jgi:hypothetical protein